MLRACAGLMALMVLNLCFTFLSSVLECFLTAHERYAFQRGLVVLYTLLAALPFPFPFCCWACNR